MNIGGRSNYQAQNITGPSGSPLKGVLHEPVKKKSTIKIIKPKVEEEPIVCYKSKNQLFVISVDAC